jgi:hypothetical protein
MTAAEWARALMAQAGDVDLPLYGSAEWEAAPEPVRLASAVRAAEAWRREADPHVIATRLETELEAGWREQERDYDGWRTVIAMVRHLAVEPTHAELVERRSA